MEARHARELVSATGERGVRAEEVARRAVKELQRWLEADVPVGEHLADQLVLLLAIAGEGAFRTLPATDHTLTQIDVCARFLPAKVSLREVSPDVTEVRVARG